MVLWILDTLCRVYWTESYWLLRCLCFDVLLGDAPMPMPMPMPLRLASGFELFRVVVVVGFHHSLVKKRDLPALETLIADIARFRKRLHDAVETVSFDLKGQCGSQTQCRSHTNTTATSNSCASPKASCHSNRQEFSKRQRRMHLRVQTCAPLPVSMNACVDSTY